MRLTIGKHQDDEPVAVYGDNNRSLLLMRGHDPDFLDTGPGCDPLVELKGSHNAANNNRDISAASYNSILRSLVAIVLPLPSGERQDTGLS